jgi:hypothetical protein
VGVAGEIVEGEVDAPQRFAVEPVMEFLAAE